MGPCHANWHHILDSQSISIGPERFDDFATKKNDIHHNDYAIHAERSQMVYARHNSVRENGFETEDQSEFYHFGFWLSESNLIFNGESQMLPSPKFDPAQGEANDEEYPVVKYDAQNNGFIDVKVPVQTGRVELSFPYYTEGGRTLRTRDRHQPHTPFADCSFENASETEPGTSGAPTPEEPGAVSYTVRCPIQVTNEIKGKRLLAILHGNPVGSSQYAKALGIINDPTGIPLSGPAPTTGNMTGATAVGHSTEPSAGASGGESGGSPSSQVAAGGGGKGGMFCSLRPEEKTTTGWMGYLLLILLLTAMIALRRKTS